MSTFKQFLLNNRKEKSITIFFDIETLQYNESLGREKPTEYKNVTYSFAFGYFEQGELQVHVRSSFKSFIDEITETYSKWKNLPSIELIAHNNNKYDNHYLRRDLIYFYDLPVKNIFLTSATKDGNVLSVKKKSLSKLDKNGVILEKRVKSSNNLEIEFYINNIRFYTTDNFMKTNTSIATLGEKLLRLGVLSQDELKTDFNYTMYNKDYDMTDEESYQYAKEVFNSLNGEQMTYIRNDIIILANSVKYYSDIFKGFSYDKITFTSNILEYYNDNDTTSYQLLKSIGKGKDKVHVKYTDYYFSNENFYDYLKSFYGGGLNFYNDEKVGEIIYKKVIAMDINSSYPYAMHNFPVPTYLNEYQEYREEETIEIKNNTDFYLYRMTKLSFDNEIIERIRSKVLRQMLVKYYTSNDYVNINTYTLKILKDVAGIDITHLTVVSYVSFETEYFASREKIADKYEVKEKGSNSKKIVYNSPYDIKEMEQDNDVVFSQEEINIAKVILNGLYGIPALRSHFNIFRWVQGELKNIPNGYENNERNIVFSVFVTAVSLHNLLLPLKDLTQSEIDEHFIYCDTDSLYLHKEVQHKLDKDLFHDFHLGKWSFDNECIDKFIVLNHKKYAYESYNEKLGKSTIEVKCGGVPNSSFDRDMSFEDFVKTQFDDGVKITNLKSIYNKQGTISIYNSNTDLQIGGGYRIFAYDEVTDRLKERLIQEVQNQSNGDVPDMLYIESTIGNFSMADMYPHKHETENVKGLDSLKIVENNIKSIYLQ